jgi:hypothetical protein
MGMAQLRRPPFRPNSLVVESSGDGDKERRYVRGGDFEHGIVADRTDDEIRLAKPLVEAAGGPHRPIDARETRGIGRPRPQALDRLEGRARGAAKRGQERGQLRVVRLARRLAAAPARGDENPGCPAPAPIGHAWPRRLGAAIDPADGHDAPGRQSGGVRSPVAFRVGQNNKVPGPASSERKVPDLVCDGLAQDEAQGPIELVQAGKQRRVHDHGPFGALAQFADHAVPPDTGNVLIEIDLLRRQTLDRGIGQQSNLEIWRGLAESPRNIRDPAKMAQPGSASRAKSH